MERKQDGSLILKSDVVYISQHFLVHRDIFLIENNERRERDWISHEPSVRVVPITPEGQIVMIREFKYANDIFTLCLPAGTRQPQENAIQAAKRELEEETGYTSEEFEDLGPYYMATSLVKQDARVVIAKNAKPAKEQVGDPYERMRIDRIVRFNFEALIRAVQTNKLVDGQALCALMKAFVNLGYFIPPKEKGESI